MRLATSTPTRRSATSPRDWAGRRLTCDHRDVTSYLQDYLEDVALERLLLGKAVPVVPRDVGTSSGVYDLKNDHMNFAITLHETIGMTLDQAVIKLGIVPLTVGAA